jgi:AcrR family transcriptional regulator
VVREQLAEIQRARILAAMVEVVSERGAASVTVAHVVARSGVSRRTFYEQFADRDECLLAALDDAIERIAAVVVPASAQPSRWRERMRAGLTALLQLFEQEPATGRFVIVEAVGAGADALVLRGHVLALVSAAVDEGRREVRSGNGPPPLSAEGVVGGVLSVLHSRLCARDSTPLVQLTGPLMGMIVLPYLGMAAAQRELARPVPAATPHQPSASIAANPLYGLDMRLTYRTVRVLTAVAELAERGSYPSNREIGHFAGVSDQGQMSKLLTRLRKLGLIINSAAAHGRGAPNAWKLTPKGMKVERALVDGYAPASSLSQPPILV